MNEQTPKKHKKTSTEVNKSKNKKTEESERGSRLHRISANTHVPN